MIVEYYRDYRIDVNSTRAGDAGTPTSGFCGEKPHHEVVTCYKLTAELAEWAGELWARRIDVALNR